MDDGSKDIEESLELLKLLKKQGAETVIATPHFYANDESVQSFIERRKKSYETLKKELDEATPEIIPGAEVSYYSGISRLSQLDDLTIEGSNILMIEMPSGKWTEYILRELEELASKNVIILAHIERYLKEQTTDTWKRLKDSGILMQVNAGYFIGFFSRKKALNLLENGFVQLIGSDCHGLNYRSPVIDKAYRVIEKRFGEDFIFGMNEYGKNVLSHNK